jgi:hypothetical protein
LALPVKEFPERSRVVKFFRADHALGKVPVKQRYQEGLGFRVSNRLVRSTNLTVEKSKAMQTTDLLLGT